MEADIAKRRTKTLASHLNQSTTDIEALESVECNATSKRLEVRTLEEERAKGNFDVRKLTYLLDGGEKYTRLKESVFLLLERDSIMNEGLKVFVNSSM
jgi:hypothetical protein